MRYRESNYGHYTRMRPSDVTLSCCHSSNGISQTCSCRECSKHINGPCSQIRSRSNARRNDKSWRWVINCWCSEVLLWHIKIQPPTSSYSNDNISNFVKWSIIIINTFNGMRKCVLNCLMGRKEMINFPFFSLAVFKRKIPLTICDLSICWLCCEKLQHFS